MQIIILGAGSVGSTLAENLSLENHDVTLVDLNRERLSELQSRLDIRTIMGNASYPAILRAAGAEGADMVIAVTNIDEVNMVACQVAYSLFHTPMKIARVRSPHYFIRKELFGDENLPIDVFINPEQLMINYATALIEFPGALQVVDFAKSRVKLVAIKPYLGGPLIGKSLSGINPMLPDEQTRVVAIFRGDRTVSLSSETTIEVDDEVFFVAPSKDIKTILNTLHHIDKPYKRIMIAGGGHIGFGLAESLEDKFQVKLIDHDEARCHINAEKLKNTMVLLGDPTDRELLISEDVEHVDVFCALTSDDEENIMSCMLAKRLGVRQVMALVTRPAYADLIEDSGINIALSPKLTTISSILAYTRRGDVVSVFSLRRGVAEAIEAVAHGDKDSSQVVGRPISEIDLPRETMIGAIVRDKKVVIPKDDTIIEPEDHIILFVANKKHVSKVEKLFQVGVTYM